MWNVSAPAEAEEKGRDHLLDEPLETGAMSPQGKYENFQPTPTVRIFQMFLIWLGQEKKKQTWRNWEFIHFLSLMLCINHPVIIIINNKQWIADRHFMVELYMNFMQK